MPTRRRAWLPVSARECTASARVAEECERNAAANLHAAIATLPPSAARTTFRLSAWAMLLFTHSHRGSRELRGRRRRLADDGSVLRPDGGACGGRSRPRGRRAADASVDGPDGRRARVARARRLHVQFSLRRSPAPVARQEPL